ncbi:YlaH-like family protein [Aquibacillus rhizosphaerae]|uniref:YlaH-like family protein n=1 Tax=Aquibacillus rhizosphaerae TaxID=3051431 RepID=A0ABT7L7D8_9BACI|nr:YlaH-like family protein [Aquibacillus sp. LR5S19]MDL4841309.1 YlaH-like family protein [Aquibacillus sp. LR5S19]
MGNQDNMNVPDDLWPVANYFMKGLGNEVNFNNEDDVAMLIRGFFFLYLTIVALTILAYKFGFAKKLPPLKSAVVYVVLIIGTFFITLIFGLNLPVAESLFVIALILGIYRLRLHQERKKRNISS